MVVLSDQAEATFRVVFTDDKREPMEILMSEFIDEKSPRAKGKRVTTLDIARIEDITPEPEPEPEVEEPEAEEMPDTDAQPDSPESPADDPQPTTTDQIEVEGVTMTFEKPKNPQLDLF